MWRSRYVALCYIATSFRLLSQLRTRIRPLVTNPLTGLVSCNKTSLIRTSWSCSLVFGTVCLWTQHPCTPRPRPELPPCFIYDQVFYLEGIAWTKDWYSMDFGIRKRKAKFTPWTHQQRSDKNQYVDGQTRYVYRFITKYVIFQMSK
jgi:hypothetical protein